MLWKNASLFRRYILSFLLVLIVPLSIVCTIFLSNLNASVQEKAQELSQRQLADFSSSLDLQLSSIVNSAYSLSESPTIARYKVTNFIRYGSSIISELRSCRMSSDLLENVMLYSPNLDYNYSSTSTYTQDRFRAVFSPIWTARTHFTKRWKP